NPAWAPAFTRLQERGRVVFSAAIDGAVYARHGTTIDTRLTVVEKLPADDPAVFPAAPGVAPDTATLLAWVGAHVPARSPVALPVLSGSASTTAAPRTVRGYVARAARAPAAPLAEPEGVEFAYDTVDVLPTDNASISDAIYEPYGLQAIRIPGSQAHPTQLVQSAAMASVTPPRPSYRPRLPQNILDLLSDAQLETVIYAGEAHSEFLAGAWTVDDTFDVVSAAPEEAQEAVRFRQGFMIGDGTGVGKGRESAAIILDHWLQGR
ncbi:strawberry notch-like NTP hydrolase domain-containing protein, partial [Mesorhizobium sp.]